MPFRRRHLQADSGYCRKCGLIWDRCRCHLMLPMAAPNSSQSSVISNQSKPVRYAVPPPLRR